MKGVVRGGEGRIRLTVRGPSGRRQTVEAVIDTGSSGWLTLPQSVVNSLGLSRTGTIRAALANGAEAVFDTYEVVVIWNRRALQIEVEQAEATPLVGMSLLNGSELRMQVRQGGAISVRPLRRRQTGG
jgi:clan AA aspartic protease